MQSKLNFENAKTVSLQEKQNNKEQNQTTYVSFDEVGDQVAGMLMGFYDGQYGRTYFITDGEGNEMGLPNHSHLVKQLDRLRADGTIAVQVTYEGEQEPVKEGWNGQKIYSVRYVE